MNPDGHAIDLHGVSLRGISFGYRSTGAVVLKSISAELPARSVTAILGPNGSGKTTLLHLVLGLLVPSEGEILLAGRSRSLYSSRDMKQLIALVPQEESVAFDLSVLDYVLLGRAPHLRLLSLPGEDDLRIALAALETTGLTVLQDRAFPSLSGGERQLATIARALAQETSILLMDEPTSHLDLANRRRVFQVMRVLKEVGKTVLFTTHDPNAAAAVADYALMLREGRILAAAPVREAFTSRNLSETYSVDVEVIQIGNRPVVLAL
jgi:iron complex transport system ATP-binding protein